jgi:hypothetical protein
MGSLKPRKPRQIGVRVRVADPAAFATALREYADRVGGIEAASDRLGVSRAQLYRLMKSEGRMTLRTSTYQRLVRKLPARSAPHLLAAVLSPLAELALRAHNEWLAGELQPFGLAPFATANGWPPGAAPAIPHDAEQESMAEGTWATLQRLYDWQPKRMKDFEKRLVEAGFGNRERWMTTRKDGPLSARACIEVLSARALLALVRLIEPLRGESALEHRFLDNRSFRGRRLGRYLHAAMEKELVLLERDSDLARAQALGDHMAL